MTAIETVVSALEARGCNPRGNEQRGFTALCPAHDDRSPSLGLAEGDDGRVLIRCYTGCSADDIVAALGLEWQELFADRDSQPRQKLEVAATYDYRDETGQLLYQVVRMTPKTFRQRRPKPDGGWEWSLGDVRRVLYRLPEVLAAKARNDWIVVVEGEKDVHTVVKEGWCATTMAGGAGKWRPEYTEALIGARVIIIADNDDTGMIHAHDVARALYGQAGKVHILTPATPHKDVTDHLKAGLTLKDLVKKRVLEDAVVPETRSGPQFFTARVFASRPAPDQALQLCGPAIQRQMRTTIGAQTGEGKTTLGLQAIRSFVHGEPFLDPRWRPPAEKGRALIVDVEQGEETIKERFRESGLDTCDAVDLLWQPAGFALDKNPEDEQLIDRTLRDGRYSMVLLDPLYQLHQGDQNSERTAADVMRVLDGWAMKYNLAILIPMHSRKPHPQAGWKQFSINDIGGNGAWVRNAEVVLGLQFASSGFSRLWFFKDRPGKCPPVRTWWGLGFDRQGGFVRNHKEEYVKVQDRVHNLLDCTEGVTIDGVLAAIDDVKPGTVRSAIKELGHQNGERWRLTPWHEQTSMMS